MSKQASADFKDYFLNLTEDARQALADRCETSIGHLRNIAYKCKPCAPELAIDIERETAGAVRCEALCPTDVDWAYIRGTRSRIQKAAGA